MNVDHNQPRGEDRAQARPDAVTLYVCRSCRNAAGDDAEPRPGRLLAEAAARAAAGSGVAVTTVSCLGNCKRWLSAAIARPGGWSYVFGGLDVADAAALVDGASLHAASDNGLLPWRGRPEPLKRGLVARIPPLGFSEGSS